MLKGKKVVLRALEEADLPRLWAINNDLEVELAGGGDPPMPQSLVRLKAEFAREAIQLLLDYAFRLHNQRRVYLRVNSNNERAIRAYQACGFIEEGRLRQHVWNEGAYRDLVYMGVLRKDWIDMD